MCACVSACESVGGGGGCFLFRFCGGENRSSRETGPRPKEAAVPCTNARSHPARYSTLSTFSPIVGRPAESLKAGAGGTGEGGKCLLYYAA